MVIPGNRITAFERLLRPKQAQVPYRRKQALAMGNFLREKKAAVRVGRTTLRECGFEAQDGETCTRLKQSGRELHGEVWTRGATCNSACPYLILGAPVREIAPDATLAVHSPRVILNFTGGVPTREVRAQAMQQAMARSDRMVLDYMTKLGADPGQLRIGVLDRPGAEGYLDDPECRAAVAGATLLLEALGHQLEESAPAMMFEPDVTSTERSWVGWQGLVSQVPRWFAMAAFTSTKT